MTNNRTNAKATVSARFKGVDSSQVNKVNDLFAGKEFCVITGSEKHSKPSVEKKIIESGGEIVQNPGPNTFCILTAKLIHKINIYIKKDLYDVVKLEWILKCINDGKINPWKPSDMFHSRVVTKDCFDKLFDAYGDSYEEDLTSETLKQLIMSLDSSEENVETDDKNRLFKLRHQIAYIENKYFPNESFPFGLFRLDVFYVDLYKEINGEDRIPNCSLDLVELKLKWHGGVVEDQINNTVTHIIMDLSDKSRLDEIKQMNRKRKFKYHVVSKDWVSKSIQATRKLDELPFHV